MSSRSRPALPRPALLRPTLLRLSLVLLPVSLLLALPTPAHAGKKARKDDSGIHGEATHGEAEAGTTRQSADGSIWDWIEATPEAAEETVEGVQEPLVAPVDTQALEASDELAEARDTENSVFAESALHAPPVDFYTDPVGTLEADPLHLKSIDPAEFDIPIVVNDAVIKWMEYFTGRGRKYYHRYLGRSTKYQPMMRAQLRAAGLPEDLVYLSMIESGYNPHAYSTADAAGLWQFITSTGRMYDLRIDFWVDERRDPEASTAAAIRLLSDLHDQYDDWYLAWAAYNAGPGRVNRAWKTYGKIDFWTAVQKGSFRPETDNYVPKLLAAAIIGKHPERYGFTDVEYQQPDALEPVEVGPSISLEVLARCAGLPEEEFQRINPQIRRWSLPPEPAVQQVYVPKGQGTSFLAALEKVPAEERLTFVHHTVRRGETLSSIASKYGVRTDDVQKTNRITNPNRITVGMSLIIPKSGSMPPQALTSVAGSGSRSPEAAPAPAPAAPRATTLTHTVRSGETLSSIAARYGMTLARLQADNGIKNANHVVVGQKLKVQTTAGRSGSSSRSSSSKPAALTTYTVRKGDTLSTIASRHGVSVRDLQSWNGISGSRILVGQTLKIRR